MRPRRHREEYRARATHASSLLLGSTPSTRPGLRTGLRELHCVDSGAAGDRSSGRVLRHFTTVQLHLRATPSCVTRLPKTGLSHHRGCSWSGYGLVQCVAPVGSTARQLKRAQRHAGGDVRRTTRAGEEPRAAGCLFRSGSFAVFAAGAGWGWTATGELARRHSEHIFAGVRRGEDLATHYASGDLFLFPSVTETFGNVTVEAMASGLAVVICCGPRTH